MRRREKRKGRVGKRGNGDDGSFGQIGLFDRARKGGPPGGRRGDPRVPRLPALRKTIAARFRRFHLENPHVYRILVEMARYYREKGRKQEGMKHLYEVLRWRRFVETGGAEDFRLPNDFTSRYARLIMENEPDLEGFFETRELRAI